MIWQDILVHFDIPDHEVLKKKCLSNVGEKWRLFKAELGRNYLFNQKTREIAPFEQYAFDKETWQLFVQSRHEPKFQEKRKKAQKVQSKNGYPS